MSALPDRKLIILQWLEKADHDLKNAEHTLLLKADCPFDTICFHAQQCVEKSIKALLVFHDMTVPKTHDISTLIQLLPPGAPLPLSPFEQESLTYYSTASRYPGDPEPYSRSDAENGVILARKVRDAIKKMLPSDMG